MLAGGGGFGVAVARVMQWNRGGAASKRKDSSWRLVLEASPQRVGGANLQVLERIIWHW